MGDRIIDHDNPIGNKQEEDKWNVIPYVTKYKIDVYASVNKHTPGNTWSKISDPMFDLSSCDKLMYYPLVTIPILSALIRNENMTISNFIVSDDRIQTYW